MDLAEVCDNAKKGREYALLGNYDSSMVYYQGVIQQIQRYCQSVRDPAVKGKWYQVGWWPCSVNLRQQSWEITREFTRSVIGLNTELHLTFNSMCGLISTQ